MPATFAATVNPIWTGRKFGVEMEMKKSSKALDGTRVNLTADQLSRSLRGAGLVHQVLGNGTSHLSQADGQAWEVKYDSSAGWEVVTPALTMEADGRCPELEKGCGAIGALRPVIDSACGLHVHVEARDLNWRDLQNLVALWARYEPFFYSMLPQSRHANNFCIPLRGAKWSDVSNDRANARGLGALQPVLDAQNEQTFRSASISTGKYRSLRLEHFWRTGRIEFRLAAGSVSYDKIRRWVTMLLSLVGRVKAAGTTFPKLNARIHQPRPELGFGAVYVLAAIGLGPSRWQAPSTVYEEVLAFCNERRARFGHAAATEAANRRPAPTTTR
jgi:hypothetical protein